MSYSEFLNRKKINAPKVIAANMSLGDASSYTWRVKMAAASVYRPTDHVITNTNDPNIVPDLHSKKPKVYAGNGYGGKVLDASEYTLSSAARSLKQDTFSTTKIVLGGNTCLTKPPASQVVGQSGNSDGLKNGLNLGYVSTCSEEFKPLTKSYFVDTIPDIQTHKVGIQSQAAFSGLANVQSGVQNPVSCSMTKGNWAPKAEVHKNLHPAGPVKTDFLTAILGPQVSENGSRGRAPKVGAAKPNDKYVEKHHGNPKPRAWGPRASLLPHAPQPSAPAQLKINSPMHYHVA
jgi:hypothetical protein